MKQPDRYDCDVIECDNTDLPETEISIITVVNENPRQETLYLQGVLDDEHERKLYGILQNEFGFTTVRKADLLGLDGDTTSPLR